LHGLKPEAENVQFIKNTLSNFKDQYAEKLAENNGDALKSLKDLK
jgi:hypothetical protein